MIVTVVIPTVDGRKEYLDRCIDGYMWRTDAEVQFIVVQNRPTCGIAWQEGADRAIGNYLHLTADDIVPGEGWLEPMARVVEKRQVPVALVQTCTAGLLGEGGMPKPGAFDPRSAGFYEGPPLSERPVPEGYESQGDSEYPSIPFCSMEQWHQIEPMIAAHYGTDKWFGWRARQAGIPSVTCRSLFYHYAAHAGRVPAGAGWLHVDRITFDQNIALPAYQRGELEPRELHPWHYTDEGLAAARDWYRSNVPPPYPWEA